MIVAKTFKGAYFGENISDLVGWHGKPMKDNAKVIIPNLEKMIKNPKVQGVVTLPSEELSKMVDKKDHPKLNLSGFFYKADVKVATRQAFGEGL
jgi:hypothetical protein